ncbi:hypothetical protein JX266_001907 [Neoarthrinium moseri]|nr:hypothetical protein JX266_001907 [Neoarthrinium moseri]
MFRCRSEERKHQRGPREVGGDGEGRRFQLPSQARSLLSCLRHGTGRRSCQAFEGDGLLGIWSASLVDGGAKEGLRCLRGAFALYFSGICSTGLGWRPRRTYGASSWPELPQRSQRSQRSQRYYDENNCPICKPASLPQPPGAGPPSDRRPPSDAESQSRLIKPAPGPKRTRPLMLNPSSKMQPSMPSSVLMLLGCIAIDSEAPLPVCAGYGVTVPQEREGFSGPARKDQLQTPHLAESLIQH